MQKPKITFDRFGQIFFVFREIVKLAARADTKFLVLVLILNAVWGFLAFPGFYLEKLVLDNLVNNIGNVNFRPVLNVVGFLIALRLALEFLRNLLSRLTGLLNRNMSRSFSMYLEALIGQKLSELDLATIEDPDFKNRFEKIENESGRRAWGLMMPLSDIPNYLVGFISAVFVIALLHPLIALGVILVSLPQFIADSKFIKMDYDLHTKHSLLYRFWGWLSYYLARNRNFMELKILNLAPYLVKRLKEIREKILSDEIALQKKREISHIGSLFPMSIFEFLISLWLVFLVIVKRVTLGSFEFYLRSLRSAQSNLVGLINALLQIYENYIYVVDLVWFLSLTPKIKEENRGIKVLKNGNYSIEFKNVWFRYRMDKPWIINGVSFKVAPGEKIALVGENGVGKSTLIKLIARFYDPQKGDVLINSKNLKDYSVRGWRRNLAVLFQKFETYPFTARESIGYGDIKNVEKLKAIRRVAQETGMDKFIESLELQYENPLTPEFEKGIDPSIGQWQRIGISRMLFRTRAKILIMDEPTSNVDPKAEEAIFKTLLKKTKGNILIFVSQRFSTVRNADRILVMDKGRIVESGTHEELMKLGGLYHELFTIQAKGYR
ncbi:hypothetical protein A2691_00435 [Candidatus Woesebacteria bacterium RIFCSPHIGHO2_01_FULL_39_23]|nr:MAG: hypothetical protein A2691_00435 [Candidatus Woesebacteria bacterium RIFCSPHIGHO2_01_FULL_39_23]